MRAFLFLLASSIWAQQDALQEKIEAEAKRLLAARREAIAQIKTPEQARARQAMVREKLQRLMGGLVEYKGPLNAKTVKTLDRGRYKIELVHFESLPNYVIAANLYLPKAAGKHPAVLYSIGHWNEGKVAGQKICAQLAVKGIACLAYDPLGQGERQQAFDKRSGKSLIGGSTEQHFLPGAQSILLGQTVARYFVHDSRRAIDYLVSRPEVDASRIGASGCSGGGTQTTLVSALDERIRATAPACYMNSFEYLIGGPTGDSEQSWPNFLKEGLDQADFVEAFTPKPWLIASTEQDFFTPAGARVVFEQAKAFHAIFDREAYVKWVVGPGGHGTPLVVREAIYDWMIRHLKDGKGDAKEEPLEELREADLWVFPQGQVPGRDLTEILAEQARAVAGKTPQRPVLPAPSGLAKTTTLGPEGAREVIVMPAADRAAEARARDLARVGLKVVLVRAAGYPIADNQGRLSGDWITHTRAWLVGWNLPLLRAADLLAVAREQLSTHDRVYLHGWGVGGIPVLLAAREEPRLAGVWLERTPISLAASFASPVHKNLHEAVIPGWLLAEDFPALRTAKTFWVDPTDWNENILKTAGPGYYVRPFEQTTEELVQEFRKALTN